MAKSPQYRLVKADAGRGLPLADESISACVTSPPYLGLRTYQGVEPTDWPRVEFRPMAGLPPVTVPPIRCCLGMEPGPLAYTAHLVLIGREIRRVLHPTGVFWLNLGCCYAGSWGARGRGDHTNAPRPDWERKYGTDAPARNLDHFKPTDLILIPSMVAFALQADGWFLRSAPPWVKPGNAMPECLDPQTKVFIRRHGWVSRITLQQLSELPELPEILSPNGWVKVRKVWKTFKPAIVMEAGKVERVICSADHRFPISSDRRRVKTRLERAADIRHEGYAEYFLYCPIDRFLSEPMVSWMGRELGYVLGYLIGVYVAEGCHDGTRGFRVKFSIGKHEIDFYAKIKGFAASLGIEIFDHPSPVAGGLDLRMSSEWFTRTIDTFVTGMARTKSISIELILNTPRAFRQGMLDGYVDGDGSDKKKGRGWSAASASRRLRDDISTLASSVGIITSKGGERVGKSPSSETITYSHAIWTPYMTRRKVKSGTEGIFQVPPRHRKKLDEGREMIDLEVEGHVFLIGDGLITHNSVQSRPTTAHESLFLLAKTSDYYFDMENVRRNLAPASVDRDQHPHDRRYQNSYGKTNRWGGDTRSGDLRSNPAGRNIRTSDFFLDSLDDLIAHHEARAAELRRARDSGGMVAGDDGGPAAVLVNPESYRGSHYAVMPSRLAEILVRCSTSDAGCCATCGGPWVRVVEKSRPPRDLYPHRKQAYSAHAEGVAISTGFNRSRPAATDNWSGQEWNVWKAANPDKFLGWRPSCTCPDPTPRRPVVLDPFAGSGTTAVVSLALGRDCVLIDASAEYLAMARHRLSRPHARPPAPPRPDESRPLFANLED